MEPDLLALSRELRPRGLKRGRPLGFGVAGRNHQVIEDMRQRCFTWREIWLFLNSHGESLSSPRSLRKCYLAFKTARAREAS